MTGRKLGDLAINRAVEMIMPFDRSAFFPGQTDEDWAPYREWLVPDAMSREGDVILFAMQSYIVRTSHHTILIDACVGNDKDRPHRPVWHRRTDDTYLKALAAHGLTLADIDFVLCTHLHGDHIGWNTRLENGRWAPTFPNARYVFSRKEYEAWDANCDPKFTRTAFEDSVLPVVEAGRADLVTNDWALDDEVWLEPTPGHTPDHVAVHLASRGEQALMCGDLIHSPVQLAEPEWEPWPDYDPVAAKKTRRAFLETHCDTSTLVCTAHFPLPSAGRIVRAGDGFRMDSAGEDW